MTVSSDDVTTVASMVTNQGHVEKVEEETTEVHHKEKRTIEQDVKGDKATETTTETIKLDEEITQDHSHTIVTIVGRKDTCLQIAAQESETNVQMVITTTPTQIQMMQQK